ncbi:hypothetical protein [Streptomyces sp. PT19]|uniref:hypothetical protein n=1 Tax=Streptomyces sp. PT19 TaxID=3452239 RepID=UPI003F7CE974
MLHTPVCERSAVQLLAQAHASDHAATLDLSEGNYARAEARALIGQLHIHLYEIPLSQECHDSSGNGTVGRSCTWTDCEEASLGATYHLH